jgi:hypothetical protein
MNRTEPNPSSREQMGEEWGDGKSVRPSIWSGTADGTKGDLTWQSIRFVE